MHSQRRNAYGRYTWCYASSKQKKTSRFDVYIGITKDYLIVSECEKRKYLNEFYHVPDLRRTVAEDIGVCFPLADIQSCQLFDHVEERRFPQAPVSKARRFRQRYAASYRISGKDYREVDCFKRESLDSYQASHNQPLHKSKPRVERVVCTSLYVFHDNILLLP